MTFPLIEAEDLPDIAADSLSIAFGDLRRGHPIVEHTGVRALRKFFSAKPHLLLFKTNRVKTNRVVGGMQEVDAIKLNEVRGELINEQSATGSTSSPSPGERAGRAILRIL